MRGAGAADSLHLLAQLFPWPQQLHIESVHVLTWVTEPPSRSSGLEGVPELTATEAAKSLRLSGDAVARALAEMSRKPE